MTGAIESDASTAKRLVLGTAKAVGAVTWTLFWANVVRLHLVTGNLLDAGATALLLVAPMLALVVWRLAARAEAVDVEPSPVERALSG